jgi:hypothetical protein
LSGSFGDQRECNIMCEDPIVDEVRKTRERLAKEFNYDVGAIFADLRKRQAEWGSRLVYREKKPRGERPPTAKP